MFQTKPCCSVFKIEYRWEYKKTVHEVDNYTFPGMNGLWSSNSKSCFYCLRKGEKSYCLILIHSILDVQYPLLQSFMGSPTQAEILPPHQKWPMKKDPRAQVCFQCDKPRFLHDAHLQPSWKMTVILFFVHCQIVNSKKSIRKFLANFISKVPTKSWAIVWL